MSGTAATLLAPVVVLRTQAVGESDLIVWLLSPTVGRRDAAARAARSSRKRFGSGLLRPFVQLEVAIAPARKGGLPQLQGATLQRDLLGPAPTYAQLCVASYATELASLAAQPDHADAALFHWLCAALLASAVTPEALCRRLVIAVQAGFLQVTGLLPDLWRCARCGKPLDGMAHWPPDAMGLGCQTCAEGAREWLAASDIQALWIAGQACDAALLQGLTPTALSLISDRVQRLVGQAAHAPLRSALALRDLLRA